MLQRWRTAAAAALPLLCAVLAALRPAGADAAGELETRTLTSYEVAADGAVHVSLSALVTNRDPSTQRRDSGRVFYYSATAGGGRLALETPTEPRDGADPFRLVVVRFGRDLYFGDSVEIAMEYDLAAVRASQVLVNQQYAFVPAIAQGTQSLVRIVAPANCARTADRPLTYLCGASTAAADYQAGGRCAFAVAAPRWDCAFSGQEFVVLPFEATAPGAVLATRTSA